MAKDFLFETEPCGRCGGSGHYSYNQIDGTVCFGCSGNKVRLTKRGKAAQDWLTKQTTVPFDQLKVGDRVYEENFFKGYRAWHRIDAIEGETLTLSFQRKGYSEPDVMHVQGGRPYRVRSADQWVRRWQQMVGLAYQATLTKDGKPRKRG